MEMKSYDAQNDSELVALNISGDGRALDVLIKRYIKQVYNFVRRIVGDERAEDITQETFLKAWKHIRRFDQKRNFKTWLFTIAHRSALDEVRKRKNIPFSAFEDDENATAFDVEENTPLAHEVFEQKEIGTLMEKALLVLPIDKREIVMLHIMEELTFDEIAKVTKRPMNTVKSIYRRALKELRAHLEKAPNKA